MPDYLFLMESRLRPEQWQVILQMQQVAEALSLNLYLVGGAVRDLIGGFPIEDLDFAVEGKALKLVREFSRQKVRSNWQKEALQEAELEFPSGVLASVGMTRTETYPKPAAAPAIAPATILEDLRRRDFSINAIGISLNPNSRGLLLDPTNGLADMEKKQLRVLNPYSFLHDPIRLFRAVRFRTRLKFTWETKTAAQFQNAKESGVLEKVSREGLTQELRRIAREREPQEILKALEKENLLGVISPRLQGARLDLAVLARATKTSQALAAAGLPVRSFPLFLHLLTRKLPSEDRTRVLRKLELGKPEGEAVRKIEEQRKKLEKDIAGKAASKPTILYQLLAASPPELLLLAQVEHPQKIVQARIRTYLQRQLPLRSKLPEKELQEMGVSPGSPLYGKILEECFFAILAGKLRLRSEQLKFLKRAVQEQK